MSKKFIQTIALLVCVGVSGISETLHAIPQLSSSTPCEARLLFQTTALVEPARAALYYTLTKNDGLMRETRRQLRNPWISSGLLAAGLVVGLWQGWSWATALAIFPILTAHGNPPDDYYDRMEADYALLHLKWDPLRHQLEIIPPTHPHKETLAEALKTIQTGLAPNWGDLEGRFSPVLIGLMKDWFFVFSHYRESPGFSESILKSFIEAQSRIIERCRPEPKGLASFPPVAEEPPQTYRQNGAIMVRPPKPAPKTEPPPAPPTAPAPAPSITQEVDPLEHLLTLTPDEEKSYRRESLERLMDWAHVLKGIPPKRMTVVALEAEMESFVHLIDGVPSRRSSFVRHFRAIIEATRNSSAPERVREVLSIRADATHKAISDRVARDGASTLASFPYLPWGLAWTSVQHTFNRLRIGLPSRVRNPALSAA